ncbi:MAG: outer membrane beta-barrel protein [Verrucomicrobiales bacterium]|jgi:opacity protein-like surface antigen|nr:outer membrane beta-barrel protein [Verrucomicrobiales bacterium]
MHKNKIKKLAALLTVSGGIWMTVTGSLSAADDARYEIVNGNIVPAQKTNALAPDFRAEAQPRAEVECGADNYIAVLGGVNAFQTSSPSLKATDSWQPRRTGLQLKDRTGWAGGLKAGHTWQLSDDGQRGLLALSLEGEFIYSGVHDTKLGTPRVSNYPFAGHTVSGKIYQQFNMDILALTVNPVLRLQLGRFSPYVGVGVGGAYVEAQHKGLFATGEIDGRKGTYGFDPTVGGSTDTVVFCFQAMAGADFYLSKDISLFLEYKYLGLVGLEAFKTPVSGYYDLGAVYGNHLATVGVRFGF